MAKAFHLERGSEFRLPGDFEYKKIFNIYPVDDPTKMVDWGDLCIILTDEKEKHIHLDPEQEVEIKGRRK